MSDDRSERLDGGKLGEQPSDDDRPGVVDYPPEHPLGVEDPSLYDEDDLETRAVLRRDIPDDRGADVVLVDTSPVDGADRDERMTGEAVDLRADDPTVPVGDEEISAEESAIHVTGDDRDPG